MKSCNAAGARCGRQTVRGVELIEEVLQPLGSQASHEDAGPLMLARELAGPTDRGVAIDVRRNHHEVTALDQGGERAVPGSIHVTVVDLQRMTALVGRGIEQAPGSFHSPYNSNHFSGIHASRILRIRTASS